MTVGSISCEQTTIKFNLNRTGEAQAFLVASVQSPVDAAQAAGEAYDRIAETLRDHGLEIIQERIFGSGAAFSRGALIQERDVSLIEISGTAAIDQQGKSQFYGDIHGQITCTFDRIETLLGREGAGLKDIAAATVFVKRPEYASIFSEMAADRGLADFPAVCVVADVCREELLFEIDAEVAVRKESA